LPYAVALSLPFPPSFESTVRKAELRDRRGIRAEEETEEKRKKGKENGVMSAL
jgi:hypothetical protein